MASVCAVLIEIELLDAALMRGVIIVVTDPNQGVGQDRAKDARIDRPTKAMKIVKIDAVQIGTIIGQIEISGAIRLPRPIHQERADDVTSQRQMAIDKITRSNRLCQLVKIQKRGLVKRRRNHRTNHGQSAAINHGIDRSKKHRNLNPNDQNRTINLSLKMINLIRSGCF